ncbi:GIY-YIG nuclease family protein, partial [Lacticaseibacillus paracasei]
MKHYKLKTKYFGKFISGKKDLDFFKDRCGIYAMVRTDCTKVYIGSSTNVFSRFQTHISKLDRGLHDNTDLQ